MAGIIDFLSEHSTAVMVGAAAGVVAAKVLHMIQRVRRLVLPAIVLAVAGGSGAGGASSVLDSLTTLR
ncbi:hypothetical protein [Mycolicibacterium fortuitum]|uniref:hypothetical protein n=1 Tax=Mycolicibacterium fortuitum TaxID=1766 RepID=UPI003AADA3D3